jgi:hypothetical protein
LAICSVAVSKLDSFSAEMDGRGHFLSLPPKAMRRILINRATHGSRPPTPPDVFIVSGGFPLMLKLYIPFE